MANFQIDAGYFIIGIVFGILGNIIATLLLKFFEGQELTWFVGSTIVIFFIGFLIVRLVLDSRKERKKVEEKLEAEIEKIKEIRIKLKEQKTIEKLLIPKLRQLIMATNRMRAILHELLTRALLFFPPHKTTSRHQHLFFVKV